MHRNLLKLACLSFAFLAFSPIAQATVDALTEVHWVVKDPQEERYRVRPFTFTGCFGVEHGPQAANFAEPFLVTSRSGCGDPPREENVNALSCGTAEYTWNSDHSRVRKVELDLSACDDEMENPRGFRSAIVSAARANFGNSVRVVFINEK
jgi:hypothetical protein